MDDLDVHLVTLEQNKTKISVEQDGDLTIHRLPGPHWPQIPDILFGPGKSRLKNYVLNMEPDVFHSTEVYGLTFGRTPFPHIFTLHGFDHEEVLLKNSVLSKPRSVIWKMIEKYGLSRLKHIICINPYVRKTIQPIVSGHLYDIENPVDKRFFDIKRNEERGRVLCVGWIIKRKNIFASVQAFSELIKQGLNLHLVIAGHIKDREYYKNIIDFIETHNLGSKIEFLKYISRDDLFLQLSKASVLLMPSLQETAPMAIAEAMAAGVPVITSNRCGMPYMIEDGHSGFLINPTDNSDITDKLSLILNDDALRHEMSVKSKQIAFSKFDANIVAAKTAEVYRKTLETQDF